MFALSSAPHHFSHPAHPNYTNSDREFPILIDNVLNPDRTSWCLDRLAVLRINQVQLVESGAIEILEVLFPHPFHGNLATRIVDHWRRSLQSVPTPHYGGYSDRSSISPEPISLKRKIDQAPIALSKKIKIEGSQGIIIVSQKIQTEETRKENPAHKWGMFAYQKGKANAKKEILSALSSPVPTIDANEELKREARKNAELARKTLNEIGVVRRKQLVFNLAEGEEFVFASKRRIVNVKKTIK